MGSEQLLVVGFTICRLVKVGNDHFSLDFTINIKLVSLDLCR